MLGFLTIKEFCEQHKVTRSSLYRLIDAGNGPRITKLGNRALISNAAAAEWCAEVDGKHIVTSRPLPTLAEAQGRRR
jgi:excisionase family DNA binding protein